MPVLVLGGVSLLLVGAVVVAEIAAVRIVHARTAAAVSDLLGAPSTVTIPDRPLLPHLLRRRIPEVRIDAERVPVGDRGARISALEIHLLDVRPPRGPEGSPDHQPWRAGPSRFEARLSVDDVTALANLPRVVREVRLTSSGLRLVGPGGIGVDTTLTMRAGDLVVRPHGTVALAALAGIEVVIDLPPLPAGARIETVDVRGDALVLTGPIDGDRLVPDEEH